MSKRWLQHGLLCHQLELGLASANDLDTFYPSEKGGDLVPVEKSARKSEIGIFYMCSR